MNGEGTTVMCVSSELGTRVMCHQNAVLADVLQIEYPFSYQILINGWAPISPHCLDTLGIKGWLPLLQALICKAYIPLLGLKNAWHVHLVIQSMGMGDPEHGNG